MARRHELKHPRCGRVRQTVQEPWLGYYRRKREERRVSQFNRRELQRRLGKRETANSVLLELVVDHPNLQAAWNRISTNDGAETPGDDGRRCADYAPNINRLLHRIARQIKSGSYRPGAVRVIDVPKAGKPGKFRTLGILTVADRIVHAAVKQVLQELLEPGFHGFSHGFRPGRSSTTALSAAIAELNRLHADGRPLNYLLHLDIADCFPSIDHKLLGAKLREWIVDERLVALIQQLVVPGSTEVRWPLPHFPVGWKRRTGLVQGSSLSPLLCNLYLHELDEAAKQMITKETAKRDSKRAAIIRYFRYADDLLLLANSRAAMSAARGILVDTAGRLRLAFREPERKATTWKTGIEWLGVRLIRTEARGDQSAYAIVITDEKALRMADVISEMTEPPSSRLAHDVLRLDRVIDSLNEKLIQWYAGYRIARNAAGVFARLDHHARDRVGRLIQLSTRRNHRKLARQHCIRLTGGHWTWRFDGSQLTNLASLLDKKQPGCHQ